DGDALSRRYVFGQRRVVVRYGERDSPCGKLPDRPFAYGLAFGHPTHRFGKRFQQVVTEVVNNIFHTGSLKVCRGSNPPAVGLYSEVVLEVRLKIAGVNILINDDSLEVILGDGRAATDERITITNELKAANLSVEALAQLVVLRPKVNDGVDVTAGVDNAMSFAVKPHVLAVLGD